MEKRTADRKKYTLRRYFPASSSAIIKVNLHDENPRSFHLISRLLINVKAFPENFPRINSKLVHLQE